MSGDRKGIATSGAAAALMALGVSLAAAAGAFHFVLEAQGVKLQKRPIHPADGRTMNSLPLETDSWARVGSDRIESQEIEEVLGTSNYISRLYKRKTDDPDAAVELIDFHAAYYTGMIDTVPHVPERCVVGAGWQMVADGRIIPLPLDTDRWTPDVDVPDELGEWYRTRTSDGSQRVRLPQDPHGIALRVSEFLQPDGRKLQAGYFFVANGSWVSNANDVRLLSFRLDEEYAYYLKVQFSSTTFESGEAFAEAAASLLDELFGDVMLCTPDWVDVKSGTHPDVARDRAESETP